jgi:nucleoside-diphosphate-sugar epimerase
VRLMKILVTGASGLIGSQLTKTLERFGHIVRGIDIRNINSDISYADIRLLENMTKAVNNCDGVIHLAGISRIAWGESDPDLCNQLNIEGTNNLLLACALSPRKPWFIYASSREVYGLQDAFPVRETCVPRPKNHYAISKLAAEALVENAFAIGLKTGILRFSNVYGGMIDHFDRVIPAICLNAINNQSIKINGKDCIYDFTHVEDVVDGIYKAINYINSKEINRAPKIHLTTAMPTSLLKLAVELTKSRSSIEIFSERPYSTSKFYGDNSLARELLGWNPKHNLEEGLKKFIADLWRNKDIEHTNYQRGINESFKSYSWLPSEIQRRV